MKEYLVFPYPKNSIKLQELLNEYGEAGWVLKAITELFIILEKNK